MSNSATHWTVACQAPLSMGFPRQECWTGLPFPSPGDHPDPGIEHVSPVFPALQAYYLPAEPLGKHIYACMHVYMPLYLQGQRFLEPVCIFYIKLSGLTNIFL